MNRLAKHGHAGAKATRTYFSWKSMKQRCNNPKTPKFNNYGGRGITVCARWNVFENFLADMGPRPDAHTLERIDSDGNYDPTNCRWATKREQSRNTSQNVWIEVGAERLCLEDWAIRLGVNPATIRSRLAHGWDSVRAVTEPPRATGRRMRRCRSPMSSHPPE